MKKPPALFLSFLTALIGGALIWGLSPIVLSEKEPWDFASKLPYLGSLFAVGLVAGLISGGRSRAAPLLIMLAVFAGQLGYIVAQGDMQTSPLFVFGVALLFLYSPIAFFGAAVGFSFMRPIWKQRKDGAVLR